MSELRGMIVPLVTPFDSAGSVDAGALIAVAEHARSHGAGGLMLTALTGEGNLLSADETVAVWKSVMNRYRGQMAIVPAIFAMTTAEAIRLGKIAADLGADAVMVAAIMPELYGRRAERHVLRFFESFCSAVRIPVVLFNYPSLAGYDLTPELVEGLAAIDGVRYIKESTSDSRRVSEIIDRCKGRIEVICGAPDVALESLALGSKAWITAITNVIPGACRALIDAVQSGDLDRARALNFRVIRPMCGLIRESSNTIGTIRVGLAARGIQTGIPRLPGLPIEVDQCWRDAVGRIFAAESELVS